MKIKKDLWCKKDLEVFLPISTLICLLLRSYRHYWAVGTKITTFKRSMESIKEMLFGQSSNMHELYVLQKKWKLSCMNPLYGFLIRYEGIWHVSSMTLKHEESILKREIIFWLGKTCWKVGMLSSEKCRMKSSRDWLVVEVEQRLRIRFISFIPISASLQ